MTERKMKNVKFLGVFLVCLLLLIPVCQVRAAGTGTVKNRVVNVRASATTSSSIVCKLSQGAGVTITSETKGSDGRVWYAVSCVSNGANKSGYIRSDLLTVSGSASGSGQSSGSGTTQSGFGDDSILSIRVNAARVRKQPTTASASVTTLNQNEQVKQKTAVTGSDGKVWIRVSFTKNGKKTYGYIRSDLLTLVKKGDSSAPATNTNTNTNTVSAASGTPQNEDILTVNVSAVRVRQEPSDTSAIITNLLQGDKVKQKKTRIGSDGKQWTKVSVTINGTKFHGYIRSDYLTLYQRAADAAASDGSSDSDARYVNASAVRVRNNVSESAGVVANLLKGDMVKVKSTKTGADGKEWSRVSFTINGTKYYGYIRSDLLSKTK